MSLLLRSALVAFLAEQHRLAKHEKPQIPITNEASPQTDEVYSVLAAITGFLGGLGVLCVRSIWHPVGDARDAVLDERHVEIDEQTQTFA